MMLGGVGEEDHVCQKQTVHIILVEHIGLVFKLGKILGTYGKKATVQLSLHECATMLERFLIERGLVLGELGTPRTSPPHLQVWSSTSCQTKSLRVGGERPHVWEKKSYATST